MQAQMGGGDIGPTHSQPGTRRHHAAAALSPEKAQYPLYRRLGGYRGRSGRQGNFAPSGMWSLDRPARSEPLYQLRYPGRHLKLLYRDSCKGTEEIHYNHRRTCLYSNRIPPQRTSRVLLSHRIASALKGSERSILHLWLFSFWTCAALSILNWTECFIHWARVVQNNSFSRNQLSWRLPTFFPERDNRSYFQNFVFSSE